MGKVGDVIEADNARWNFSGDVAARFDAHVEKSIPFYHEGHELIVDLADFFLGDGALCVDLGCATGALLARLAAARQGAGDRFVGIDCEPAMCEVARARCAEFGDVAIECGRIEDMSWEPADLAIAYYTMQFVRPRVRQEVFNRIYERLAWGGGFVLFEKVRAPDARFQDLNTALYQDYKLKRGYSGTEIVEKARSLKGVLEPFSTAGNLGLLHRAGFADVTTVFKYLCFEGFLAIK